MFERLAIASRAFRHRNFRLFFMGQAISVTGAWMHSTAIYWLMWQLTQNSGKVGLLGFFSYLPMLLVAPFAGPWIDRFQRQHLIFITQTISMILALLLAVITLGHWVQPWHLMLSALALGCTNALDSPARNSFDVDLVGKEDVTNAAALNTVLFNVARLIGPALAGAVMGVAGAGWCFGLNAVSFLAVIFCLRRMDFGSRNRAQQTAHHAQKFGLLAGFHYVKNHPRINLLLLLLLITGLGCNGYNSILPAYAEHELHGQETLYGLLLGAIGAGALLTGLYFTLYPPPAQQLMRWTRLGTLSIGLSFLGFSCTESVGWAFAVAMVLGAGIVMLSLASKLIIQLETEASYRGRVLAVYIALWLGMTPFSMLLLGSVAHQWGAAMALRLGGIICLVALLMTMANTIRPRQKQQSNAPD
ncbi:MAG: MFS transporter [Alphaproteobacteria bacterium]